MGILKNPEAKVDRAAMNLIADRLGLEGFTALSEADAVGTMREAFDARLEGTPKDDWIECSECGEFTDDDGMIDRCPFCGDVGEDDLEHGEEGEDDPVAKVAAEMEADEDDEENPDAVDIAEDEDEEDGPEEPPVANLDGPDEEPEPEPESDEEPAKSDAKKAPAKKKKAPAKKKPGKKASPPPESEATDLASPEEDMAAKLATWKKAIDAAQTSMVGGTYDLGVALREIHKGELWKADGHKTFNKFLASIGIGRSFAYEMMELAGKFTRGDFLDVGTKKLSIVARAGSDEEKDRLLEQARDGASKRELDAAAKSAKPGKGKKGKGQDTTPETGKKGKGQDTAPEKGKSPADTSTEGTVTLLAKVGGRPKTIPFVDKKTHEKVAVWKPDTYAKVHISEDVDLLIALKFDDQERPTGVITLFRKAEDTTGGKK